MSTTESTAKHMGPEDAARLFELHAEVHRTYDAWRDKADDAKAAKAAHEAAQDRLGKFLDELADPAASTPLFDKPPPGQPAEAATDADVDADPPGIGAVIAPPPGDDSWRDDSLAKLGLPAKLLDNLNDADLFTVGQLADWTTAGKLLTDIGGVGPAKAAKVEDALIAYWASRQAPPASPAAAPEAEPEAGPAAGPFDPPTDWAPEADREED